MSVLASLRKLARMPASELTGRAKVQAARVGERLRHAGIGLARPNRLRRALRDPAFRGADWQERLLARRRADRPRFFDGAEQAEAVRALFADAYAAELREALAWADRAMRHEVHFFGERFTFGDRIPWHQDPVSRREWPRRFHQDVPLQDEAGCGDVKYVWELNRHHFVLDLGKAYFLTGREEYAQEVWRLVVDWLDENPYGVGVNWASPLEPAYRTLAWLWAYRFTIDSPSLDGATHARWVEGFFDAARFLSTHLELYASPYNHLLGEACALYAIGVMFPELRPATRWRARGRRILIQRLPAQFHRDGGTVEQATCYHHASLGFYLLAALLGRANGDEFPDDVWRAIERGIEFSMALMQPDGTQPAIGDSDDARPVCLERRPLWDYRAFQAVGAVLFERGDFKTAAGRFHEDALWLLGPRGLSTFDCLAASATPTSIVLHDSGYVVMRNADDRAGDYVCFDCGPQAGGLHHDAVPSAAHGHADCLSVVAWLGGRPVLVDSGFFTYNSDRAWERHFRETAAHNTVRIDERDQALHLEKMAWAFAPRASLEVYRSSDTGVVAAGWHDGYARGANPILHRRTVWLRSAGYLLIRDDLVGGGEHRADVNFQFPPGSAAVQGAVVRLTSAMELHVLATPSVSIALACGGPGPSDGWIAPGLGVRVPAPRVRFGATFGSPGLTLVWLVADSRRVQVTRPPERPLAAVVAGEGTCEIVAAGDIASGHGKSSLTVWRVVDGAVVEGETADGTAPADEVQWVTQIAASRMQLRIS